MSVETAIIAVINTLGTIELHGEENMRAMLNCIDTLRNINKAIGEAREADNGKSDSENDQ